MSSKFIDLGIIGRYDDIVNEKIEIAMQNSGGEKIPIGTIFEFPTDDPTKLPTGYLFCDGSAVSRTQYADLFAVIGTTWGSGDGSTTFNLPSKAGLVTVGVSTDDEEFNTIGDTYGEKEHRLTIDEMPSHNHNVNTIFPFTNGSNRTAVANSNSNNVTGTAGDVVLNAGGGYAHNNIQPSVVSNFIIKAANVSQLPDEAEVVDGYSVSTTDAYSANYVNSLNTYSTGEQRIGTWIDGKPIYRKVFSFTTPNDNSDYTITTNISNMMKALNCYGGIIQSNGSLTPIPTAIDFSGVIYSTSVRVYQSNIIYKGNAAYGNSSAYVVIEYTKTTD